MSAPSLGLSLPPPPHLADDDVMDHLTPPLPSSHVARTLSYVVGGLAVALIVTSIVLLVVVRHNTEVVTTVVPSPHVVPTVVPPLPKVALQPLQFEQTFSLFDLEGVTSPVASVTDTSPNTSSTPSPPDQAPGLLPPFADTLATPLQTPPQGYGWVVFTPDAQQWFSSLPNGYAQVAQYLYTQGAFAVDSNAYSTTQNNLVFCRNDPADPQNDAITDLNRSAAAVGSVGYRSLAMSADGTRLYVTYRQPLMGTGNDAQIFPFLQLSGQVATFSRPTDPSGGLPSATSWAYQCALALSNPYGSATAQFDQLCDPTTGQLLTGDDFGATLRTTVNRANGRRVLAARANFGLRPADGALVAVFEETDNDAYALSGVVYLTDGTTAFTLAEKLAFARDFAVGDDALMCAVRTPAGGCGVTTPRYQLFFFLRNATTLQWEYQQTLPAPPDTATDEDFGVSVVLNPEGTQALVGSPRLPSGSSPGIGGHVYMYQRHTAQPKVWTLTQTFADPLAPVHAQGAFGYFLSVDPQFLVVAISANQNNVLTAPNVPIGSTPDANKPAVVLVAIDQAAAQLDASAAQQQIFPENVTSRYLDPLYGSGVGLAFEDEGRSVLRILFTSPLNQTVYYYTLTVS